MATYHCKVQIINKKSGRGIIAAAAYRSGQKLRDEKSQVVYDYRRKTGILHTEIMAPWYAPEWVYNRETLWNAINNREIRKDARFAREFLLALPIELSTSNYKELMRRFVDKNFVKLGMIADFAIHAPSVTKSAKNFHVHILLTQRSITREGFGLKVPEWDQVSYLNEWRKAWAEEANRMLELEGFECRIDHRSRATKERELADALALKLTEVELESGLIASEDYHSVRKDELTTEISEGEGIDTAEDDHLWHDRLHYDADKERALTISEQIKSAEWVDPKHNLTVMQEHRFSCKKLLHMKDQTACTPENRIEALELLDGLITTRLESIKKFVEQLPEGPTKEWLEAFSRLENANLKQSKHSILADILEEKNAPQLAREITERRHLAEVWRRKHFEYLSEWHFHAVTDKRYIPLTKPAGDLVNKIRNQCQIDLKKLRSQAMQESWTSTKLNEKIAAFKQQMDKDCKDVFGLEKNLAKERGLSR